MAVAKNLHLAAETRRVYTAAVRSGALVRRHHCERCGCETKTSGHHADYAKPLKVEWLCNNCHVRAHACGAITRRQWKAALKRREQHRREWEAEMLEELGPEWREILDREHREYLEHRQARKAVRALSRAMRGIGREKRVA